MPVILRLMTTASVVPGQYPVVVSTEMDGVKVDAPLTVVVVQAPPRPVAPTLNGPAIPGQAKWESEMTRLGAKWCDPSQVFNFGDETQVWFYDGARVYYQMADYTRDSKWTACAVNVAKQYRDYVLKYNGSIPAWRVHPHGLLMAWQRTGDVTYRNALDVLSRNSPYAQTGGGMHFSPLMRDTAYVLQAYVAAERAGFPRSPIMTRAATFLIGQFSELFLPETVISKPLGYHMIYMDGLAAAALIEYYELTGDARVPPIIKAMLDWVWTNCWSQTLNKLWINPEPLGPQCTWGCQQYDTGLINLTVPAYAWYWQLTGDPTYQLRGDQMFSHSLDMDISWDGKIFSQNYRWSFDYVKWRSTKRGAEPTAQLSRISLYPARMKGGATMATNVVVLDRPAPSGGVVVTLTSSVPSAAQPQATVVVPAGQISAVFSITSFPVTADTLVTFSASAGGVTKTGTMTITR